MSETRLLDRRELLKLSSLALAAPNAAVSTRVRAHSAPEDSGVICPPGSYATQACGRV